MSTKLRDNSQKAKAIVLRNEVEKPILKSPKSKSKEERDLADSKIKFGVECTAPNPCLTLEDITIGTLGNFGLVIGKAKSRKTFFLTIALAAATKNVTLLDRIAGNLPEEKNQVLFFDTEQSNHHVQLTANRIASLCGLPNPYNLNIYGLRKYTPKRRLELIEHAIYNTPNLGLVVIDGARDVVTSINDEIQATEISSKLLKWTEELEIHVLVALHQNKGDTNARGHLGTELVNKAETVLSITKNSKDKNISIVQAEYCRDKEPEPFAFEINEKGLPKLVEGWKTRRKLSTKIEIENLDDHDKHRIWIEVFQHRDEFIYEELWRQTKVAFKKLKGTEIGDNRAKEFVSHAKTKGWLMQEKVKSPYRLNQDVVNGL